MSRYGVSRCITIALWDPMFNGSTSEFIRHGAILLRFAKIESHLINELTYDVRDERNLGLDILGQH